MRFVKKISTLKKIISHRKKKGDIIGFVPTMGYIHEGHLSLVRTARKQSQFVVVSIFVNPPQFGPKEDFRAYPRDLKRDMQLLKKEGVDVIFNPTNKEIYPEGYKTYVEVFDLSKILCGVSRPTHFQGVTTIVLKLFNIVQPDIAVFGKKDYQQTVIIRQMVKDLNLDVKIVIGKIVREKDGLAMSSRNTYLSNDERRRAVVLYRSLQWVKNAYKKGLRNPKKATQRINNMISKRGGRVNYVEAVDKDTLKPVRNLKKGTLIGLAVYFGKTRLIDNIII
ncbi:pantoate--beta-alanine ligase [candidate division TA06 bacterium DG_78]|uniref:Pantothenate synthetase n=1 Tax=candidate division TA06 bacterium DG_78 TaxID=1703772 RepID=A0A0S7YD51_UNCT6|nr:MAG: pantoate--beta-alanine ligase [candidate division TA06 bacterium DG_78]